MKKFIILLLVVLSIIVIFGINNVKEENKQNIEIPKKEEHSNLYIEGLSVEDVITYFDEIVLGAEFINSGNPYKVQKWTTPIYYVIKGNYTIEDMNTFDNFIDWLNNVDGFPGIYEASDEDSANLVINFCSNKEMINILGNNFYNTDGGVTFWYNNNSIYKAVICYRTDISQEIRNSVILEELYNGLGPINDTKLREDSIIYSEFSTPQSLTSIDELLLKLLYNEKIKVGMVKNDYENIIRELYY